MLILSIDSTAKEASAALTRDGKMLGEVNLNSGYTHSEALLPAIEFLISSAKLTPADIDIFAAAVGPGSFTGVRIGAATIKGLSFGRGKCCAAVSTLEALAENIAELRGIAVSVMDARRGQVYTATFDCTDGTVKRLTEDDAMPISELCEMLESMNLNAPIYLVGDGYDVTVKEAREKLENFRETPTALRPHSAVSVGKVAKRLAASGELTDDISLTPYYLRLSQAEREYNEKHNIKE